VGGEDANADELSPVALAIASAARPSFRNTHTPNGNRSDPDEAADTGHPRDVSRTFFRKIRGVAEILDHYCVDAARTSASASSRAWARIRRVSFELRRAGQRKEMQHSNDRLAVPKPIASFDILTTSRRFARPVATGCCFHE
jgi:hypothetical protein